MSQTSSRIIQDSLPYPTTAEAVSNLFEKIRDLPLPVWLSSGDSFEHGGRYEILCAEPEKIITTKTAATVKTTGIEESQTITTVTANNKVVHTSRDEPLKVLQQEFEKSSQAGIDFGTSLFPGGAIGYFAYDLLHPWQKIDLKHENDISLPEMLVGIYQWAIVVDHQEKSCVLITLPSVSEEKRKEILDRLLSETETNKHSRFALTSSFASNFTEQEYESTFNNVIDYINAGDCYQVNLAQRFTAQYQGDPFIAFNHLNKLANAPFSAYIQFQDSAVLSFSPERFIKANDREILTQPIKGTRPRNSDTEKDRLLLKELQDSLKDQAENLMIVDLLRNDLGRVCATGSVSVPNLFEAQSFNNVHHLVSTVVGELEKPEDVFDLFAACFPGGSITGAPKIRSMEIIRELETRPRSVYCGSIGYFSFNGNMDSNICIRTLVCSDQQIHCWGGGGVVADSDGAQEYQETLDKISLFLSNLSNLSGLSGANHHSDALDVPSVPDESGD